MIQSRFTSSEAVEFEFKLPDDDTYRNRQTLFLPHFAINFSRHPTNPGNIEIIYSDDQGEDMIWTESAQNKTHIRRTFGTPLPVPKGAKIILRYTNPNSVEVTARFLWQL